MKRIIPILLITLCASVVMATDKYVMVFIKDSMPQVGFTKVLENVQGIGGDANIIDQAEMPVWYELAHTNITGKIICIRIDDQGIKSWNKKTLVQARIDIKDGLALANKDKVIIKSLPMFEADYAVKALEE